MAKIYTYSKRKLLELDGVRELVRSEHIGQNPRVSHCTITHYKNGKRKAVGVVEHDELMTKTRKPFHAGGSPFRKTMTVRVTASFTIEYSEVDKDMGVPLNPIWKQ